MKETKNTPQLRFSEFDVEWEEKKLGEIVTEVKRKADSNSTAPVMMISATQGFINQSEKYSADNAGSSLKNYTLLKKGELSYNHGYSKTRNFGSCFTLEIDEARIPFVYHSFSLDSDDSSFFGKYLNSGLFDKELKRRVASTARMDGLLNISFDEYVSLIVKKPTLAEQQKIGTFLSHVDSLIQAKTKKLESLKAVKKSLLQKCFPKAGEKIPEMRFAGFSGDWEKKKLGEFCKLFGRIGFRGYTEKDLVKEGEGAITLSPSNIVDGIMNYSKCTYISWYKYEESPEIKIHNGDILFVKTGSTFGKTALVTNLPCEATINPQFVVIKKIKMDNVFLSYLLSHDLIQNQISSTVVGGAIPTMSQEVIKNFNILIPSTIKEQQKIGQYFSKYDSLITAQQKEIDKLKDIKKSLLQKMFV